MLRFIETKIQFILPRERFNSAGTAGFTLIEVLVAIVLVAIVSLTTTYSTINAYALYSHSTRSSFARQLAFTAMEELAARDPLTLSAADGSVNSNVTVGNASYTRTIAIAVNSDGSRTATVTVVNNRTSTISAQFSNTFALWGNT